MPIERSNELNELGWWSNWARLSWLSKNCYRLGSREFREPLFNHAGFLDPKAKPDELVKLVEREYSEEETDPAFFLQRLPEHAHTRKLLLSRGYTLTDTFLVLRLAGAIPKRVSGVTCRVIGAEKLDEWCETYLRAFYGELSLLKSVVASVKKALGEGRTRLVLAFVRRKPAGTLAVYRWRRLAGVYCVGTIPEFRERGVATAMLRLAKEVTESEGTALTLQTFLSDSLEKFYYKRGFELAYSKDVLVKK
jgi:GNAT superfamily N-acetyltransferase